MDVSVKSELENYLPGMKNDPLFVNCYLSAMFEPNELIGKSLSGKKNKAGESTTQIDSSRYQLLKGKINC
jgi:hypothetical protein